MTFEEFARVPLDVEFRGKTLRFYYNPMLVTDEALADQKTIAESLGAIDLEWEMTRVVDGAPQPVPIEHAYRVIGLAPRVWRALLEDLSPNSTPPAD